MNENVSAAVAEKGEDSGTGAVGPLRDVEVLEFAGLGPVPFAGMILADLGARIIRVDRVASVDPIVGWRGRASTPWSDVMGRGRRSIALNIKTPQGHAIASELARRADVLMEGFRPGVMERLNLGPNILLHSNPHLVYARASAFDRSSRIANLAGHDLNCLALSGALHPIGPRDRPPPPPSNYVADFGGGSLLATGIVAATMERIRSGRGQVVDLSLLAASSLVTSMLQGQLHSGLLNEERGTNELDGAAPYYRCYETKDKKFLAVAAIEPQFYYRFLAVLGIDAEEWPQADRGRWERLGFLVEGLIRTRTRREWVDLFEDADACVSPVLTPTEAPKWPGLEGLFADREGVSVPAATPQLSDTSAELASAPPQPGDDTLEILRELGLSPPEIEELRVGGAV